MTISIAVLSLLATTSVLLLTAGVAWGKHAKKAEDHERRISALEARPCRDAEVTQLVDDVERHEVSIQTTARHLGELKVELKSHLAIFEDRAKRGERE